jgi:hypothetical protein
MEDFVKKDDIGDENDDDHDYWEGGQMAKGQDF